MLLSKEKISRALVGLHKTWRHSGFNAFCGPRIEPADDQAMEHLARYIVRASFSQERITDVRDESKAKYQFEDPGFSGEVALTCAAG